MKRMTTAIILMVLLTLFLLAGALPAPGGQQAVVFKTPVFAGLLAALAGLTVFCVARGGFGLRRIGYLLTHLGAVVLLAGAGISWIWSQKDDFILPVESGSAFYREIPLQDGRTLTFPFGIACTKFKVEHYDPTYDLYKPVTRNNKQDFDKVSSLKFSVKGELHLGKQGTLTRKDLYDEASSEWKRQYVLPDGWILQQASATPKMFEADLEFQSDDKDPVRQHLAVNQPVAMNDWRFYLMSYGDNNGTYVVLTGRRDMGRFPVVVGIWMLMLGTVLLGIQGLAARNEKPEIVS